MTARRASSVNRPGTALPAGQGPAVAAGPRADRLLAGARGYTVRSQGRRVALGRLVGLTQDAGDPRPTGLLVEPGVTGGQAVAQEIPCERGVWVIPTRREVIVADDGEARTARREGA